MKPPQGFGVVAELRQGEGFERRPAGAAVAAVVVEYESQVFAERFDPGQEGAVVEAQPAVHGQAGAAAAERAVVEFDAVEGG